MPRNPVDWAILVLLLLGALAGARRGLVAAALGALGRAAAFALALWGGPRLLSAADAAWHVRPQAAAWLAAHGPLPAGFAERAAAALRAFAPPGAAAPAAAGPAAPPAGGAAAMYALLGNLLLEVLAAAVIYLVAGALIAGLVQSFAGLARAAGPLAALDRAAGAVLGLAEAALTAAVLVAAVTSLAALAPASAWARAVDGSAWGGALLGGLDRAVVFVQQHAAWRGPLGG
ncbi:MAG: CvpA family protein [Firmicutes bacterium]|nr:CvpA family protein [Bacillota bacterium]